MSMPLPSSYTLLNEDGRAHIHGRKEAQMDVSIRVKGHLDPSWREWLEGLQIVHESDGTSRLFGPLQDQPALHGALTKIGRLNLTLLSLECSELTNKE